MLFTKTRTTVAALTVGAMLLSGCTLFDNSWSSQPTATLLQVQDDYRVAEEQAAATEWALHDLYFSPNPDLRQAHRAFCREAGSMEAAGANLVAHADGIHYRGGEYLVEPEVNSANCPLPGEQGGQTRPVRLGDYYQVIDEQAWGIKEVWRAYQFDIEQLCGTLHQNLNQVTIDAFTPLFGKAAVDNASLIEALGKGRQGIKLAGARPAEDQR